MQLTHEGCPPVEVPDDVVWDVNTSGDKIVERHLAVPCGNCGTVIETSETLDDPVPFDAAAQNAALEDFDRGVLDPARSSRESS